MSETPTAREGTWLGIAQNQRYISLRADSQPPVVGEAEVTAMSWGFDSCYLLVCADNAPAVSLYKKLGFTVAFEDDEAKTSEVEQDGTVKSVPAAVLVMRKSLK